MGTIRPERYLDPAGVLARRETLREYVYRHRSTTGSAFRRVQRRINYGLTNAEWNALTYDQRVALNACAEALRPRRLRVR